MKIAVIGSGGWGTAIAILLSSRGHNVYLWSWIQEETDRLKKTEKTKNFCGSEISGYNLLQSRYG